MLLRHFLSPFPATALNLGCKGGSRSAGARSCPAPQCISQVVFSLLRLSGAIVPHSKAAVGTPTPHGAGELQLQDLKPRICKN